MSTIKFEEIKIAENDFEKTLDFTPNIGKKFTVINVLYK